MQTIIYRPVTKYCEHAFIVLNQVRWKTNNEYINTGTGTNNSGLIVYLLSANVFCNERFI